MNTDIPERFDNVTVTCKANVYFEGRVVSHSVTLADGSRKTIGLIYPGAYTFNTGEAERMAVIAGNCRARLASQKEWTDYGAGAWFDIPAQSSFEIEVREGLAEYICSFG